MTTRTDIVFRWIALTAAVLSTFTLASCGQFRRSEATDISALSRDTGGNEVLPAPTGQPKPSGYRPENPYAPLVSGMLARRVTQAEVRGTAIQIRDILVGPGQTTERATLESTAVYTVLNGSGQLRVYSARGQLVAAREVRPGSKGAMPLGASFAVENSSGGQFDMRLRLIAAP